MTEKKVSKRKTIHELVALRNKAIEDFDSMNDILKANIDSMNGVIRHYRHIVFDRGSDFRYREKFVKELDAGMWSFLIQNTPLLFSMTTKVRKQFLDRLNESPEPFNSKNIGLLFANIRNIFIDNALETIREVYATFINCGYRGPGHIYKRDNLKKVEESFRVTTSIAWNEWGGHYEIPYGQVCGLEDLLNAAKLLDDKTAFSFSDKDTLAHYTAGVERDSWVKTPYFNFRVYRNGNCLVKWHDKKVLADFNRIGASTSDEVALPDTMRKRYKREDLVEKNGYMAT